MGHKLVSLVADRVKQELTPPPPINERVEYTLTKMQIDGSGILVKCKDG